LLELINQRVLLVRQKLGVTDNVDEQNMDDLQLDFLFDLGGHAMTSLAIVGEQSFDCYSIGESKTQVDWPLRWAMLQVSGFAAILASSKGLLDPPISRLSARARRNATVVGTPRCGVPTF
jgi:hypothetical protein